MTKNHCWILVLSGWLGLLTAAPVRAQTNFRPGYVLPLAGDTLRGEVDLRDGRANAERCRFRASAQAEAVPYLPAGLRGYGFTAERQHYRALDLPAAGAATAPGRYFLEVLADGPAALYFLRDAQQHEFFYVASPQLPLTRLDHALVRVVREGRTYTEEQSPFRGTLRTALAGCPAALALLPGLPFQVSALRRVINLYNVCQGQAAPTASAPLSRVTVGILVGAVQHTLFYNAFPLRYGATALIRRPGFAVGPELRFTSPHLSSKLSIGLALLYEPEKYEFDVLDGSFTAPSGSRAHVAFDLAYLRLPLMARYTYPRGKLKPLAEAGFTVAYAIKTGNSLAISEPNGQNFGPSQPLIIGDAFRTIQLGAGVGLGLSTRLASGRTLALFGRGEFANGFLNSTEAGTTVLHLYGLLSYDLTK